MSTRYARVLLGGVPTFVRLDETGGKGAPLDRAPWEEDARSDAPVSMEGLELLAPVVPTKIVAVGRNYRAHAEELGNVPPPAPLLFFKPPSAVVGPGHAIVLPPESERVEHEAELAVVIGRTARHVRMERAMEHVFGLTCANDVTARDLQKTDGQWARAKGFDTFCPLGPCIATGLDPADRTVVARVDGKERQHGHTRDLLFPVPFLVEYVSRIMTLWPGDLILTGTPAGVGPLAPGNVVDVEIDGIGTLTNPVEAAPRATGI